VENKKNLKKDGTKNKREPGQYLMSDGTPYPHVDFEPFWEMCKDLNIINPAHFTALMNRYKEIEEELDKRKSSLLKSRIKYYIKDNRQQRLIDMFGYFIEKEHKEKFNNPVSVLDYLKANHKRSIRIEQKLDRIEKMLEQLLQK
jgi:hypothetical protein